MTFKGVSNLGDFTHSETVRTSIASFLDDAILRIGGYTNVNIPNTALYGGSFDTLIESKEPSYSTGKVWVSPKKNWVWERISDSIAVSGIYVNGVFTTSGYQIDYKNGRVVFDTAIAANSTVKANFSYKTFQVDVAEAVPLFQRIQQRTLRVESLVANSGSLIELVGNRVQLPCIAIQSVNNDSQQPYQLGSLTSWWNKNYILHILGTNEGIVRKMADILTIQKGKTIGVFDIEELVRNSGQPLDYRGYLNNPSGTYDNLISNYRWNQGLQGGKVYVENAFPNDGLNVNGLHYIPVTWTVEGVLYTD